MASNMVIGQPQPVMILQHSDEWGSGICDCTQDMPDCCFALWCLPCFACSTSRKFGECICLPLLDICRNHISPVTMSMRTSIRRRYGIKDTICEDCVYSSYCVPCSWCQMSREMKRRKIPIVLIGSKTT